MTLKLYFAPGACSFVPHVLLEASGAAFEPVMVKLHKGEQQSPEYRAINPRAQVPVLVDGAEVITQILAIIGYLNDRFPQLGFLPAEPLARARAMETLAWMNNTVHPAFTHIFMPQKFSDNPAVHEDLRRYNAGLYRGIWRYASLHDLKRILLSVAAAALLVVAVRHRSRTIQRSSIKAISPREISRLSAMMSPISIRLRMFSPLTARVST